MSRMQTWMIVLVSVLLGFAVSAGAAENSTPEYSADSTMETSDGVVKGTVYVAPGKERRENVMDGEKSVMIIRHDKKVIWMLMPDDKMYTEMKPGQGGERKDDLSAYKIDQTTVGPDTVNGIQATKSKIIMIGSKGDKLGGFMWTTKEGIMVKMDAIAVDKNSKERFKTELTNLKIGKQKASLFEIPDGYSKMDMGMGGLGKMMGNGRDDGKDEGKDDGQPTQEKGKKGFGLKDAIKLFK